MTQIPIALQLYSVRHDLDRDLRGTLQAVAEMGYAGVEFAGAPKHSAQELKPLLDEFGLACCGWHTPFALVQDDALDTTIAFNQALDNPNVIVPGIPANLRETREDWLKLAEFFNRVAAKLAAHGMATGYHNHHVEFAPLDGERPWDTFFGNTGKGLATFVGAAAGAAIGAAVAGGSTEDRVIGGVAGGVLGGVAGNALSPDQVKQVRKVVEEVTKDLPSRVPQPKKE